MAERLRELGELQDRITADRRADLVGSRVEVLVDEPGVGRTYREAPEIDGVVLVTDDLPVGEFVTVEISASLGPDLVAT
jgi:ribosomal protein S12 methylthiotransferase